jgi:uncharacterized protein
MPLPTELEARRAEVLEIARRHGVTRVMVFGSMARGHPRPDSDLDLLVEVGSDHSPWFPAGLVLDLQELLGRHVDVVTVGALEPRIRGAVLAEAISL